MDSTLSGTVVRAVIDARGKACPGPIVELGKAFRAASPGDRFELLATDPGSCADVPAWAEMTGNVLESAEADGEGWRYVLRKA